MPRKEEAAESDSNATLCDTCAARRWRSHSCALDARPPPTVPRTARCTHHTKTGKTSNKANAHTNTERVWVGGGSATVRHLRVCLSLSVCMCVCARMRMCTFACHQHSLTHSVIFVCAFTSDDSLYCKAAVFCVLCAPGSPWNSRWRSCIERTRVASAAPWSSYRTANKLKSSETVFC